MESTEGINIWVLHNRRVLSFEADFATGSVNINTQGVIINAYDRAGTLVAQNTNCKSGVGANVHCKVEAPNWEIGRIQFIAAPGYYIWDTAKFGITNAPFIPTVGDDVEGTSVGHNVTSQSTPAVPPTDGSTPPVVVPSPCTLPPCTTATVVDPQTVDAPPVPPIVTPFIAEVRAGPVRAGPVDPITIFGGYDPAPIVTPRAEAPALCIVPVLCIPEIQLLAPLPYHVDGVPSQQVTPPITVSVETGTFSGEVTPYVGYFGTLDEIYVQVGPVPVRLCSDGTCFGPIPPNFETDGYIKVTVRIGDFEFSEDVQPRVSF